MKYKNIWRKNYSLQKKKKRTWKSRFIRLKLRQSWFVRQLDKIVMNQDATSLVFMSEEEFQGFDGTEIKKAESEKDSSCRRKSYGFSRLFPRQHAGLQSWSGCWNKTLESWKKLRPGLKRFTYIWSNIYAGGWPQRIARDIHDTVVQGLTALIHKNEFVGKIFETDKQRAQLELKRIITLSGIPLTNCAILYLIFDQCLLDDLGFEKTFISN